MNRFLFTLITLLIGSPLLFTSQAAAHKVRVFAYESGGEIVAEAKFSSGRPAQNAAIELKSTDGNTLLSGVTDELGVFRFPLSAATANKPVDLTVVVDVGEGHRGSWLLTPADYLGENNHHETLPAPPKEYSQSEIKSAVPLNHSAIERIIDQSLQRELAPIKRMLAMERQKKITLQDILGGVGYILGLAGIAAYFKSKKREVK